MHAIYELKDMLCKELEEYGEKGELTTGSLDVIDKLAHTIKNLDKIIECYEEEGYSGRGGSYADGNMGGNAGGGSYARRRGANQYGSYARGRYNRRNSMGRYSREGGYSREDSMEEMVESIRGMMQELPENVQHDAQRFVEKLEQQM